MAEIKLKNVKKVYPGGDLAINNVDLTIKDGSFTVLLGPSGSGKSTLLRMIAGLETITEGSIYIDSKKMNDVPARDRDIAMVFQNYALYPSMTVRENIEFGLKNMGIAKDVRDKEIQKVSEIVDLVPHLNKKPSQLSGGQRQRVALARAMVKKPKVFIFDEPLSNLDAKLRVQMRTQLIELHQEMGTTFVYVTHDQIEAMSMGTDIILLNFGEVQQYSSPHAIYYNPNNVFTAGFMGTPPMNLVPVSQLYDYQIEQLNLDTEKIKFIGFRPEVVTIEEEHLETDEENFRLHANLRSSEMLGSETVHTFLISEYRVKAKDVNNYKYSGDQYVIKIPMDQLYYFDYQEQRL